MSALLLEARFATELAAIRCVYPSEPVACSDDLLVLSFAEAVRMPEFSQWLRETGRGYDWACLGGSAEAAVWRQPVAAEAMGARLDALAKTFYDNSDVGVDLCPSGAVPPGVPSPAASTKLRAA